MKTIAQYLKEHGLHDNHRGCKASKRIITKEKISRSCRKQNIWRNYKYPEDIEEDKPSMAGENNAADI